MSLSVAARVEFRLCRGNPFSDKIKLSPIY